MDNDNDVLLNCNCGFPPLAEMDGKGGVRFFCLYCHLHEKPCCDDETYYSTIYAANVAWNACVKRKRGY